MQPFFVFALPRSRTLWLSRWLTYGTRQVGHDITVECDTIDDFLDSLTLGLSGTVETAAVEAWPLIREAFPKARIAVVFRPIEEVRASLLRAGVPVDAVVMEALEKRLEAMTELARQPGVLSLPYAALSNREASAGLFEHLTGEKFDSGWWEMMIGANIQIDMPRRLRRLAERGTQHAALKQELAEALERQRSGKWSRVGLESIETAWPDAEPLARAHFAEVEGEDRPWRPFDPNLAAMHQLNRTGNMRIVTARRGGVLQGYMTWLLIPDFESVGLVVARQGAWYAGEGTGAGLRLVRRSIALMRRLGADHMELHHRVHGRGRDLSGLFRRLGAIPVQHEWSLHLGG